MPITKRNRSAERLERVRTEVAGAGDLKSFWMELTEEIGPDAGRGYRFDGRLIEVSYSAVRTWHADRYAPVHYLGRIAKLYPVPLSWLVSGEGEMRKEEEAARPSPADPLVNAVHRAANDPWPWLPPSARRVMFSWLMDLTTRTDYFDPGDVEALDEASADVEADFKRAFKVGRRGDFPQTIAAFHSTAAALYLEAFGEDQP